MLLFPPGLSPLNYVIWWENIFVYLDEAGFLSGQVFKIKFELLQSIRDENLVPKFNFTYYLLGYDVMLSGRS